MNHKVTVGEFIDLIEINGYPQEFGGLFESNYEAVINPIEYKQRACAMGQGLLNLWKRYPKNNLDNLRWDFYADWTKLPRFKNERIHCGDRLLTFRDIVTHMNDNHHWPIQKIVDYIRKELPKYETNKVIREITA